MSSSLTIFTHLRCGVQGWPRPPIARSATSLTGGERTTGKDTSASSRPAGFTDGLVDVRLDSCPAAQTLEGRGRVGQGT